MGVIDLGAAAVLIDGNDPHLQALLEEVTAQHIEEGLSGLTVMPDEVARAKEELPQRYSQALQFCVQAGRGVFFKKANVRRSSVDRRYNGQDGFSQNFVRLAQGESGAVTTLTLEAVFNALTDRHGFKKTEDPEMHIVAVQPSIAAV